MGEVCKGCQKVIEDPNPRIKDQGYHGGSACQKARRAQWQREKMKSDKAYRENQKDAQGRWRERHKDYWWKYREGHQEYTEKNRVQQRVRNARQRGKGVDFAAKAEIPIAKMDPLEGAATKDISGRYRLFRVVDGLIAKMDSLEVEIEVVSTS